MSAAEHYGWEASSALGSVVQETLQSGKYRILHEVGRGGMAVVYKGIDTALDREVAIKVLHPHLSGRADSRMRLQREAKAVAKLQHPNIVEIFDYSGSDCEQSYIVTEYIRGETLKDLTDRQMPRLPEIGVMIVHEVATALAHAHEARIIHRDIKPENIMIRDDGVLKLMDFGIAQIVDMQAMTVTGALVGSPAHMSPEHVEGKTLDYRADVFSLGTLLYFLCAGSLPFDSPSPHALLRQILEADYDDPRRRNPAIGRALQRIIARCLAQNPDDRYASVLEFKAALAEYLTPMGLTEPTQELTAYFDDPPNVEATLCRRVVDRLMALAQERSSSGNVAAALEYYNRVLALQDDQADAEAQIQRLSTRQHRRERMRRMAAATLVCGLVGGLVWTLGSQVPVHIPVPSLPQAAIEPLATAPTANDESLRTNREIPRAVASTRRVRTAFPRLIRRTESTTRRKRAFLIATAVIPPPPPVEVASPRIRRVRSTKQRRQRQGVRPSGPQPAQTASGVTFKIRTGYGAEIHFDGRVYPNGYTPDLTRSPGAYPVKIHHPDCGFCVDTHHTLRLNPDQPPPRRGIRYDIGFKPAALIVHTAPGSTIVVGGKALRNGAPTSFNLRRPEEEYAVRVSAPGAQSVTRQVKLRSGHTKTIRISLQPEPAENGE